MDGGQCLWAFLISETIQGLWRMGAIYATPPAPVNDRMFFAVGIVLGIDLGA
ncbi:unnamed protein product [Penicillium camemberti]|uniref:Str. FM013 n=1 Tax=Penicillium camemberti (strain FM 013) TaxID=1429867 RepID=A0A0G4P168_PENC3|nr:unnamed protein product [Penicillium camemberti]